MMTSTKWTIEDIKSLAKAAELTSDMIQAIRETLDETVGNLCIGMCCEYAIEEIEEDGGDSDEAFRDLSRMKSMLDKLFLHLSKASSMAKKLNDAGYGC